MPRNAPGDNRRAARVAYTGAALVGGVAFGGLLWFAGGQGPAVSVAVGVLFAVTWMGLGRWSERKVQRDRRR